MGDPSSYLAASITAVLFVVRSTNDIGRERIGRRTLSLFCQSQLKTVSHQDYIQGMYIESRLTLSRAPQAGNFLLNEPRFEIRVLNKPVRGASESFSSKSLMGSLVVITRNPLDKSLVFSAICNP